MQEQKEVLDECTICKCKIEAKNKYTIIIEHSKFQTVCYKCYRKYCDEVGEDWWD